MTEREAKIVMKDGQMFVGVIDHLTPEGIILDGYCTRLCFEDMIFCRDEKREVDYLRPWVEPTHVLVTVTGEPILRASLQECKRLLETKQSNWFYKILPCL